MSMRPPYPEVDTEKAINVASVPQRSPFRYPGGKTWLIPYVRLWLRSRQRPVRELIEPFAGGAIVGLTAAAENLSRRVTLVELDADVASVWQTILGGRGRWLAQRVADFEFTPRTVRGVLTSSPRSRADRAFATILRNRVQRGGILASGAGLMKQGENGKGLASRWYPQTLRERILDVVALRDRLRFICGDGLTWIKKNLHRKNVAFFVDPPYTVAGRRLYRHSEIDHFYLFGLMKRATGDFLMTYDDSSEIRQLVIRFGLSCEPVTMKNTHNENMAELLIGRDLGWLSLSAPSRPTSGGFSPQTLPRSQDPRQLGLQLRARA